MINKHFHQSHKAVITQVLCDTYIADTVNFTGQKEIRKLELTQQ